MQQFKIDFTSLIVGILFMVVVFWALSYVVSGIYMVLKVASPVLFIIALILNYQSVLNFGKWLIALTKRNPLQGVIAILLSLVLFPLTCAYLAVRAFFSKKVKEMQKKYEVQQKGEFVDYEDVTEPKIELPSPSERPRPQSRKRGNEYDNLFD